MKIFILITLASAVAAVPQLSFKCSTAMLCVDRTLCDKFAVISKTTVTLTEDEELFRHPLVTCVKSDGGEGVCCRDPDYKDDWPTDWVDPGRMSFEEYMALRIKKMVYSSTSPKPVPTEQKRVTVEPKVVTPVKSDDVVKTDDAFRRNEKIEPVSTPTTTIPKINLGPEHPTPNKPSSLDDSVSINTPKTLIIGHGRVEDIATPKPVTIPPTTQALPQTVSSRATNIPKPSTVKVTLDLDNTKIDRSYAGPPPPVKRIQSEPIVLHPAQEQVRTSSVKKQTIERNEKTKKVWPNQPIVVVSDDSIEVHAKPNTFEITSIEQTKPSKTKKVVFTKDLTPKKREKVTTAVPSVTPVPAQTGLHPLLLTGCPRRNRTAMPDLNTLYDDSDFEAGAGEFPWQGAVFDRKNKFLCGCYFTEEDTCVTTASCVEGLKATDLKIAVGIYDINTPTKVKEVPTGNKAAQILDCEAIDRHAYFSSKTKQYDLAVLFITQTVKLNYFTLPICIDRPEGIPVSKRVTTVFDDCVATGWGTNDTYHWFDVQLLPESDCAKLVPGFDGSMQSCARSSVKQERNICDLIENGNGFQCRYMGDRMSRKNDIYWLKGTLSQCIVESQILVYSHLDLDWFEETINARRYKRSHLWREEETCRF